MRELGGVFGIAISVAVFATAGSYESAPAFTDGFTAAMTVAAGLSLLGALAGTLLPSRPRSPATVSLGAAPATATQGRS
jgi:hypothetical protein